MRSADAPARGVLRSQQPPTQQPRRVGWACVVRSRHITNRIREEPPMSTQTTIDRDELFIGGEWIKPRGSDRISVLAASTEDLVGSVPDGTNADIDAAVNAARSAFEDPSGWSSWSREDRAQALERL